MEMNLIVDGNYILYKNVFTLHKINTLRGDLWQALLNNFNKFREFAEFNRIFLVSDSSRKSWRKDFYPEYKAGRKKDETIDWTFVHEIYDEFKKQLQEANLACVLEAPSIEGDDWISIIARKSNAQGIGVVSVTSDRDMQQLLTYSTEPLWMNIQITDEFGKERIYFPNGYEIALSAMQTSSEDSQNYDIFDLSTANNWVDVIQDLSRKYRVSSVEPAEVLFRKILEGDSSDNITSLYETTQNLKTGGTRQIGIGEATGEKIWNKYIEAYPEYCTPKDFRDEEFLERVIPILEVVKKIQVSDKEKEFIESRWKRNLRLIELHHRHMPKELLPQISKALEGYL